MSWSQRLSSDLMILYCWIWKLESSMRRVDRMALRLLGSWLWPLSPLLRKADWASSPSSRRCSHQSQCIKCLTLCLLSLLSDHWAILCLHKSFLRALKWFPVTSRKCPKFYSGCTGTSGFFHGKGQCQIAVLLPLVLEQLMASFVSFSDKSSIFSYFFLWGGDRIK